MERRLAAILAIDVVGFSGLIARDEAATLERLARLRRDIVSMQVEAHRGRLFKNLGDGFLAEFSSTLEAVKCAIGLQRMMALHARDDGGDGLVLRIGVSLGDVVVEGEDLLGEGVNIAARLEAMAEPGGIAVSGEVMSQVQGKVDLPLVDGGHRRLKPTDAPVHVFLTRSNKEPGAGGFLDFDEAALRQLSTTGGCLCGKIRYEIAAPALSSGYCHCSICQKFSGSAMSTWTAFPAAAVRFVGAGPCYFATSPIAERGFCPTCGSSLTYKLLRPREAAYLVVFTPSLDDPKGHAPSAHSGMESRQPWFEILDDLPRTTTAESRVLQEAWASVGLVDPATWGPCATAKDVP